MIRLVATSPIPTGAEILPFIAKALEEGRDPINDATRDGGILVPEEIVSIAADMETVAEIAFRKDYKEFHVALITEIDRARGNGDDPIEEVRLWLNALLEEGSMPSS